MHECINLYDTSYAVGYFFPLNSRQIFLFYKALCNIFQHFPCLFLPRLASVSAWVLIWYQLPSCPGELHTVSIMVWCCAPQASMARLPFLQPETDTSCPCPEASQALAVAKAFRPLSFRVLLECCVPGCHARVLAFSSLRCTDVTRPPCVAVLGLG